MDVNRAIVAYHKPNYLICLFLRTHAATCERMLMSISYCASNNNKLKIDDITFNKNMEDLRNKFENTCKMIRFINAVLPLIKKSEGHDGDKDALKLKST